jgi:dephospho-CoA kinase
MPELSEKKIIGLTGSMGSGKSTVASIIRERFPVLDCDEVNRDLLKKGNAGYEALLANGLNFLNEEGNLDKQKMASAIFSDEKLRKKSESILHPLIFKEMEKWISRQGSPLVFVEMPLLFEISAEKYFDVIWCVISNRDIALERLQNGRDISAEEALARWKAQLDPDYKKAHSHYVIINNGSLAELREQILDNIERSLNGD